MANVGGLLGLCMGFSLVSVVEMLYFGVKEKLIGILDSILGRTNVVKHRTAIEDTEGNTITEPKRTKNTTTGSL